VKEVEVVRGSRKMCYGHMYSIDIDVMLFLLELPANLLYL
jgi:hypothetical protein